MRTVFADDSEISAKNIHRHGLHHLVAMAAVAFTGDGLTAYTRAIRTVRAELGVPVDCELKWSPPNGSWLKTEAGNQIRPVLRRAMLRAARDAGARSVTIVYDRTGAEPLDQVRTKVLRYLYDKVSLHLANSGGTALMIADEPGGGGEARRQWLAASRDLTTVGTVFTAPDRIGLPIMACPSDHLEHLQLADLVAGATTAAVAGNPYALELRGDLALLADRNRAGRLGGRDPVAAAPRGPVLVAVGRTRLPTARIPGQIGSPVDTGAVAPVSDLAWAVNPVKQSVSLADSVRRLATAS